MTPRIDTNRITLLLPNIAMLEAAQRSNDELAAILGLAVPDGWPEFPHVLASTLDMIRTKPDQARWWLYLFVDRDAGTLVGSGGLKGPPIEGVAEIGYEIAPRLRGRGYAGEAARLLVQTALTGGATIIDAHTLAEENASVAVLRKLGFHLFGDKHDPGVGDLWHWRMTQPQP